jgi:hypothetical protein
MFGKLRKVPEFVGKITGVPELHGDAGIKCNFLETVAKCNY